MENCAKIKWEYLSNISFKELDGDIVKIQDSLSAIDYFSNPGIHIINTQPGSGKSYAIKEKIKGLEKCLIMVKSHKISENEYNMPGLRIWKGFSHHSHEYNKAKELSGLGIPIGMICGRCNADRKNCSYHKQFNSKKAVAPSDYIDKKYINKQNKMKNPFKFKNLIVDEEIWETTNLELNEEDIKESINVISKYHTNELLKTFITELFFMNFSMYNEEYFKALVLSKNSAIKLALKEYNGNEKKIKDDISKMNKLDPYKIRKFLYYREIYHRKSYPEPNLYHVFDIARQGIPVVLLDATFDEEIFKVLFARYCFEDEHLSRSIITSKSNLNPLHKLKTTIYKSNLEKKDANIYRMNKNNIYYKKNFFKNGKLKEKLSQLEKNIGYLKRKYDVISIITTFPLQKQILKESFSENIIVEHYRNLKGLNKMKDSDAIILYGTPSFTFEGELKNYNDIFLTDFESKEFEQITYEKSHSKWYEKELKKSLKEIEERGKAKEKLAPNKDIRDKIRYNTERFMESLASYKKIPFLYKFKNEKKDEELTNLFNKQQETGQMDAYLYHRPINYLEPKVDGLIYQALMRARIYRREGTAPDVFMFCHVPHIVDREFNPTYYDYKETKKFFETEFEGIYPLVLKKKIDSHSGYSKDIAKELKLRVRGTNSLNTKFVTAMKKNPYPEIKKIDEGIKKGFTKSGELKREYPSLKRFKMQDRYTFKKFIEDCVYETKK